MVAKCAGDDWPGDAAGRPFCRDCGGCDHADARSGAGDPGAAHGFVIRPLDGSLLVATTGAHAACAGEWAGAGAGCAIACGDHAGGAGGGADSAGAGDTDMAGCQVTGGSEIGAGSGAGGYWAGADRAVSGCAGAY